MPIPIVYRRDRESAISNFEYSEISSGRAIKRLYLADLSGATITNYQLVEGTIYGDTGASKRTSEPMNINFDIVINRPLTIQGGGVFCFATARTTDSAPTGTSKTWLARILKVNGSTETFIASGACVVRGNNTTTSEVSRNSIGFNIPLTTIPAGDKLRLHISGANFGLAGNSGMWLSHDPKNRTTGLPSTLDNPAVVWTTTGTESFLDVPVRIDL